jgi:signal transduction histidine kinase
LLSLVSSYHLITLFELGNPTWIAVVLAITFELGAIFSFIAVSPNFLYKLKKNIVLSVFMIIVLLQILGNVYATYDYAMNELDRNPKHLENLLGLFMNIFDEGMIGIILSFILGFTIPICALLIFKATINYVEEESENEQKVEGAYNQMNNSQHQIEYENENDKEDNNEQSSIDSQTQTNEASTDQRHNEESKYEDINTILEEEERNKSNQNRFSKKNNKKSSQSNTNKDNLINEEEN